MKFKYRFKGKVNSQFVLRGMPFKVGYNIDFCVSESELEFVKSNCTVLAIIDLEPKMTIETPEPVLERETEKQEKSKGVKNELQSKPNGSTSKSKHKTNI